MTNTCFQIDNACFSYGRHNVIDGISGHFRHGLFYGILGPNGCGKTTFLDLLSGHKTPNNGDTSFQGTPLKQIPKSTLSKHIALVSQNFYINFPYSVFDIVMMGRYPYIPRFSSPSSTDYRVVDHAMAITESNHFKNHCITELSGGERQRVVFARALAQDTDVLLLDEATSNLDINHSITILQSVKKRVQDHGITVISVFHDINLAAVFCDELVFMKQGKVVASGPTSDMMDETIIEDVFQVPVKIRFEPLYQTKQAVFKTTWRCHEE